MKIIIVDKSILISSLIKEELSLEGHLILCFDNARVAKSAIEKTSPDLIISGGRFSDSFTGMDFLLWCRNILNYNKCFVVTSSYPTHSPDCYLKFGADFYIDKNLGFDNTLDSLKNIIKLAENYN